MNHCMMYIYVIFIYTYIYNEYLQTFRCSRVWARFRMRPDFGWNSDAAVIQRDLGCRRVSDATGFLPGSDAATRENRATLKEPKRLKQYVFGGRNHEGNPDKKSNPCWHNPQKDKPMTTQLVSFNAEKYQQPMKAPTQVSWRHTP